MSKHFYGYFNVVIKIFSSEIKGILYNEKTINNLSNGVLEIYQPRLEGVKNLLLELT